MDSYLRGFVSSIQSAADLASPMAQASPTTSHVRSQEPDALLRAAARAEEEPFVTIHNAKVGSKVKLAKHYADFVLTSPNHLHVENVHQHGSIQSLDIQRFMCTVRFSNEVVKHFSLGPERSTLSFVLEADTNVASVGLSQTAVPTLGFVSNPQTSTETMPTSSLGLFPASTSALKETPLQEPSRTQSLVPEGVDTLVAMGFTREVALHALRQSRGDVARGVEFAVSSAANALAPATAIGAKADSAAEFWANTVPARSQNTLYDNQGEQVGRDRTPKLSEEGMQQRTDARSSERQRLHPAGDRGLRLPDTPSPVAQSPKWSPGVLHTRPVAQPSHKGLGMRVVAKEDGVFISQMAHGGVAASAEPFLQIGDRLLSIDGEPVRTEADVRRLAAGTDGTGLILHCSRRSARRGSTAARHAQDEGRVVSLVTLVRGVPGAHTVHTKRVRRHEALAAAHPSLAKWVPTVPAQLKPPPPPSLLSPKSPASPSTPSASPLASGGRTESAGGADRRGAGRGARMRLGKPVVVTAGPLRGKEGRLVAVRGEEAVVHLGVGLRAFHAQHLAPVDQRRNLSRVEPAASGSRRQDAAPRCSPAQGRRAGEQPEAVSAVGVLPRGVASSPSNPRAPGQAAGDLQRPQRPAQPPGPPSQTVPPAQLPLLLGESDETAAAPAGAPAWSRREPAHTPASAASFGGEGGLPSGAGGTERPSSLVASYSLDATALRSGGSATQLREGRPGAGGEGAALALVQEDAWSIPSTSPPPPEQSPPTPPLPADSLDRAAGGVGSELSREDGPREHEGRGPEQGTVAADVGEGGEAVAHGREKSEEERQRAWEREVEEEIGPEGMEVLRRSMGASPNPTGSDVGDESRSTRLLWRHGAAIKEDVGSQDWRHHSKDDREQPPLPVDADVGAMEPRVADRKAGVQMATTKYIEQDIRFEELRLVPPSIGTGTYKTVYKAFWNGAEVVSDLAMVLVLTLWACLQDGFGIGAAVTAARPRQAALQVRQTWPGLGLEVELLRRFNKLRHPYLPLFHGVSQDAEARWYLVSEYFPLGGLDVQLEIWEGRLSLPVKLCIGQQICEAMLVITQSGVLHRDLATRNVLVHSLHPESVADVWVKVTDFGLAREGREYVSDASDATVPWRWVPPEVMAQQPRWSVWSDVWSFGVTLWELFSDALIPYFEIHDDEELKLSVRVDGLRLQQPEECPEAVYSIMSCCWAHAPEQRPSFEELARLLQQASTLAFQSLAQSELAGAQRSSMKPRASDDVETGLLLTL